MTDKVTIIVDGLIVKVIVDDSLPAGYYTVDLVASPTIGEDS